jgi:cobalt transporter subunit CbtA
MLFRRLIYCSLFVGLCAGLVSAAVQLSQVVPIIASAEAFESMLPVEPEKIHQHGSSENAHSHDDKEWTPAKGLERTFWTVLSNVLSSIGFALLLISIIVSWSLLRRNNAPTIPSGLIWGVAGWICLFAWPALGLPPELPGEAAAGLELRQSWWLLSVVCAVSGLGFFVVEKGYWRWLAIPLLALPFMVGAPHIDGPLFAHHAIESAVQLEQLKLRFILDLSDEENSQLIPTPRTRKL